jgi:hypothetical protein
MDDTRKRILDVALEILGQNPDSGMGDIASAAQDLRVARLPVPENALLGAGGVSGLCGERFDDAVGRCDGLDLGGL